METFLTLLFLLLLGGLAFYFYQQFTSQFSNRLINTTWEQTYPSDGEIDSKLEDRTNEEEEGEISSIRVHPVKGCRPIFVDEWPLTREGLKYDREWVIVDENLTSLNMAALPRASLISAKITDSDLVLSATGMEDLTLPLEKSYRPEDVEMVSHNTVKGSAIYEGQEASDWITKLIDRPGKRFRFFRGVPDQPRCGADVMRHYDLDPRQTLVTSHDVHGFRNKLSLLMVSEESYKDFLQRMEKNSEGEKVPIEDFRASVILRGLKKPYNEDTFAELRIDDILLRGVMPCRRCPVTTIEKETCKGRKSLEPMTTLKTYRSVKGKGAFGHLFNFHIKTSGATLKVGQKLFVRQRKQFPSPWEKE